MKSIYPYLLGAFCIMGVATAADAHRTRHVASHSVKAKARNVVIFVADGLRYGIVKPETAPTLARIQHEGVDFRNSHSLYPTVTTTNASVIATGHGVGDTGEWSNSLISERGFAENNGARTTFAEDDASLKDINALYSGNVFNEVSFLALARQNGFQTAAIGKEGPVLIQDIGAADGASTIIIDDSTGGTTRRSISLNPEIATEIVNLGLNLDPQTHRANGSVAGNSREGLKISNAEQQRWFAKIATKVVLPRFVKAHKPFAMVYWSRDPDGTQHNTGDSINTFYPGINGETSLSGVRDASDNLQQLIDTLKDLGVYGNTDIIVTADHGFSTVSRTSKTSWSAAQAYPDTLFPGELPEGFAAIDVAHALSLPLNGNFETIDATTGKHPKGTAYLGSNKDKPVATFISAGNSELIYIDPDQAQLMAPRIVEILANEDYTGAIFVADTLGHIPGTLPLSAVGLRGAALTKQPSIYVSYSDHADPVCLAHWENSEL